MADSNIVEELGIGDLPEEERLKILDQMTELVQKRVMIRIMEKLTDEEAKEAEKFADDPEKLAAFFSQKVPNMMEIVEQETDKVKAEMRTEATDAVEGA